ncbi:UNVERIFIED_CONTAM: Transposon Ty2-B Gag-Pol polyprotein [Sesamum radiatum]|uniref:Transposon Ty2-B Gag-Pol polyprotein n=1 Tax=Sesamum radiatum TaxID=300843 RepID=A0AAW2LLL7_SESRA
MFVVEINMISNSGSRVLDTGCRAHICNDLQVLQRRRRLSKDEMILRLGDEKAVTVEAVGYLRLIVSKHIRIDLKDVYFVPNMHARLGHISKDRIRRLVDSESLEIDNLDHLPTCESCLKGKMTKKLFVRQSTIANGLLDLVHTDICGPLSIPARGGFSYFITFTDDHSRYGYVYLMRYKFEAFGRFKEYRLEVENQINRKIKALRSDRGELPRSFWSYAFETAAKLLNITPSKSVPQTPYEIWHGKLAFYRFIEYPKETVGYFYDPAEQKIFVSRNAVFLKKGFPSDNRRHEVLIEESNEELHHDSTTSFEPTVHSDSVPVLCRSTRESRVLEGYGFVGLTSELDNYPKTYGEAMSISIRISGLRP